MLHTANTPSLPDALLEFTGLAGCALTVRPRSQCG
jgi:hypothetical protein